MSSILYKEESYNIIGAAMEVHRIIGNGFTEPVYQDALEVEMRMRGIPYEREKTFDLSYKGVKLDKTFRADFVCYNSIIVELKSVYQLADEHTAQVYNYLKASGLSLGLLLNFGRISLQHERIPCTTKWEHRCASQFA
jgi:GxxExxY protein